MLFNDITSFILWMHTLFQIFSPVSPVLTVKDLTVPKLCQQICSENFNKKMKWNEKLLIGTIQYCNIVHTLLHYAFCKSPILDGHDNLRINKW